jgi:hypothetical protein
VAAGDNSFAAGHRAKANHQGAFVWADSTEADFATTADNQFLIRAAGGVGIGVNNPAGLLDIGGRIYLRGSTAGTTAGLWLDDMGVTSHSNRAFIGLYSSGYVGFWGDAGAGWGMMMNVTNGYVGIGTDTPTHRLQVGTAYCDGSAWYPSSDRNLKENFKSVDTLAVLDKVAAMPVSRWNYKQDTSTEHIGPMAQDFHAAFNVGPDDKHIADVDEGGVALAAIQGLNQKLNEKDAEIQALKQSVAELKETLTHLTQQPN